MTSITVFTPTYNRAYILPQLYKSLLGQTYSYFTWLIVDDGSTDGTKELIDKWIGDGKVHIRYFYQENAGKMQAHNKGVEECNTNLFVCVDSDDYITNTALEELVNVWDKESDISLAGIVAKRGEDVDIQLGVGNFPNKHLIALRELRENHFNGDTTICLNARVIKQFSFPFIEGEKYITERYLYDQIDQKYKYIVYPRILTICKYLTDGYTMNADRISYQNPVGMMYYYGQSMKFSKSFRDKINFSARYNQYRILSKHEDVFSFSIREHFFLMLTFPVGWIGAIKKSKRNMKYGK